ncbi:hypothetical protein Leryth_006457 [Lithospermum erythrorhizon]|nr:hypothetical protein Leryth_006457 [Lithospermum erythrorhizon]
MFGPPTSTTITTTPQPSFSSSFLPINKPIILCSGLVQHCPCYFNSSKIFRIRPHSTIPSRYFHAASSGNCSDTYEYDPELREVLELATDSELYELRSILFGKSYFSPLLKSIGARSSENEYFMIGEDLEERDEFISMLESRFFYLAADARATLRGWRPSYRNVLLNVRKKLKVPCSGKLNTEDLEVEIFLHVLREYSSEEGDVNSEKKIRRSTDEQHNLQSGLNQWKIQTAAALEVGAPELRPIIVKGGWMFTLGKIYNLLARRLSGKMFLEAAKYQIKKDVVAKGGQLAAMNLEASAALLLAKQGLKGAASRYIGLRSMLTFLGQ